MEKFRRTVRGYNPEEVNAFLDKVIAKVESMVADIKAKNEEIRKLNEQIKSLQEEKTENTAMKEKLEQYERMESTLNKAIIMAQKTSDQLKVAAHKKVKS